MNLSIVLLGAAVATGGCLSQSDEPIGQPFPQGSPVGIEGAHVYGQTPSAGCGWYHCAIASGGTDHLTITRGDTRGLDVVLDDGPIELSPLDDNGSSIETVVTASGVGAQPLTLFSDNMDPNEEQLISGAVIAVKLVPVTPGYYRYNPMTRAEPAYVVGAPAFLVTIHGYQPWLGGKQGLVGPSFSDLLVDTSLTVELASPGLQKLAWDRFALPARVGRHDVTVNADSFGVRSFSIDMVAGIDRIEAVITDDSTQPGDAGEVCFYAFFKYREVHAPFMVHSEGAASSINSAATNCRGFMPSQAGTYTISASALGLSTQVDFTIK